jgi:hypothetical protein
VPSTAEDEAAVESSGDVSAAMLDYYWSNVNVCRGFPLSEYYKGLSEFQWTRFTRCEIIDTNLCTHTLNEVTGDF